MLVKLQNLANPKYIASFCLSVRYCSSLQAMNLISIAQQCGSISTELYMTYSNKGMIEPPAMSGVDQLVAKKAQESQNPFLDNGSASEKGYTGNGRPMALGIPAGPSPRSSQVLPPSLSHGIRV